MLLNSHVPVQKYASKRFGEIIQSDHPISSKSTRSARLEQVFETRFNSGFGVGSVD